MLILDQHFSSLLGSHHHYLLPLDKALTPPDYPVVPRTIGLNMVPPRTKCFRTRLPRNNAQFCHPRSLKQDSLEM